MPLSKLLTLKITATYSKQGSGKFYVKIQNGRNALCTRENRLLASLHLFVCRFVSVAPTLRISAKAHNMDFRENLSGKSGLVEIDPKLLRS